MSCILKINKTFISKNNRNKINYKKTKINRNKRRKKKTKIQKYSVFFIVDGQRIQVSKKAFINVYNISNKIIRWLVNL